MTPQTQAQIARWMGWTPHGDGYWLIPAELDTSPAPGRQSGEPRRLPDLGTFLGRAEWVELIKIEFRRRKICYFVECTKSDVFSVGWDVDGRVAWGATELTALEAAVKIWALINDA